MKQLAIVLFAVMFVSCNRAPQPIVDTNAERPVRTGQVQNVIAHTTENQTPKPANSNSSGGKWSQSGDPIDTSKFDTAVTSAEKDLKAKPSDNTAKKALAQALFERGFALTEARQYASALGDYRRALKYDPNHEESKKWIDQIVSIYRMLKKDPPKEGQEPPPLPFKKEA
jgi:hypothetical protein